MRQRPGHPNQPAYIPPELAEESRRIIPTARHAATVGRRVVKRGCVDISKQEVFKGAYKHEVVPLENFLTDMDFEKDQRYLTLTRPMNFGEIEFCKRISLGDSYAAAVKSMYGAVPWGFRWPRIKAYQKRMDVFRPLVDYFQELHGMRKQEGAFSVREAFESMKADIRACQAGKERYALTEKFVSMCGLEKQLQAFARSEIGGVTATGENDAAPDLYKAQALAGLKPNGTPTQTN